MKHPRDRQLLDVLASGRTASAELARHLDECADCRQRLDAYAETWDILGRVREEDIPAGLAMDIMRTVERERIARKRRGIMTRLWDFVGPIGRAAAVIVAASAVGFALGRFTAPPNPVEPSRQRITSHEAARAAFLDQLGSASLGINEVLTMASEPPREDQDR